MTDEELILLHKDMMLGVEAGYHYPPKVAQMMHDRIEALIAERDALFRRATLAEEWRDHDKTRAEAAEAKLEKAVEALEVYACGPECADGKCYDTGDSCGQFATATLARVKGGAK